MRAVLVLYKAIEDFKKDIDFLMNVDPPSDCDVELIDKEIAERRNDIDECEQAIELIKKDV